ncbi:MAG: response regulator transcription factor [Bacteroidales bacterium]|nr:response regulator transcription factor [Bacteroidales bacterium]MDY4174049.1 response regulator transcription factor [Bacteroidales bacterium]
MAQLTSLKIAVAEQHVVVRMGIMSALRRVLGGEASYLEIGEPADLDTRIASFMPSVVIASPTFGGQFDIETWRGKCARETRFVALVSSVVESRLCRGYDAQISIFDTEDDITNLFRILRGENPEPDTDTNGETLSEREKEVVKCVVSGLTNKEIADKMNISVYTVLTHRRNIARKLNIHSSIALTIYAISNKFVDVGDVKQ